jgi:hypothetical protein
MALLSIIETSHLILVKLYSDAITRRNKELVRPKGRVEASICEISQVDPATLKKKKQPYMFQISFAGKNLIRAKTTTWIFAVNTEDSLNLWLDVLTRAKNLQKEDEEELDSIPDIEPLANRHENEERLKILKEEAIKAEKEKKLREESLKKSIENEKRNARKREKLEEEERRKQERENELKRLKEEAEKKKKEELDFQRREKYRRLLDNAWDYRFQKLWSQTIMSGDSYENNLTYGIRMFTHLGVFRQRAINASKSIIDELYLPKEKRRFKMIDDTNPIFFYQNMLLRLTWFKDDNAGPLLLAHEFRANEMLADALFLLSRKEPNFNMRVPLFCMVDYKGFRMLVQGMAPLNADKTLVHGPSSEGIYRAATQFYKHLSYTAQILNLKEHKFEWDERIAPAYVHLSAFTQLHRSQGYSDLEEYVKETVGEENPEQESAEDHIYLVKVSDILPIDIDLQDSEPDFSKRLRPEYLCDYEFPLSADAFLNSCQEALGEDVVVAEAARVLRTQRIPELVEMLDSLSIMPIDSKSMTEAMHAHGVNVRYLGLVAQQTALPHIKDICVVEIIARAAKKMLNQHLAEVMFDYAEEGKEEKSVASDETFTHLGDYVKAKHFEQNYEDGSKLHEELSKLKSSEDATMTLFQSLPYRKRAMTKKITMALIMPDQEQLDSIQMLDPVSPRSHIRIENALKECTIDFINLMFGAGDETDVFWESLLIPRAAQHFNIPISMLSKNEVNLHALLHAVIYHCSIQLLFYKDIELGRVESPFIVQNLERLSPRAKIYSMKNVEYRILADKYSEYRQAKNHNLSLQACNLKLRVSKAMNTDPEFLGEPHLLADIGEVLLETGDIENAMKKAKEALLQVHPLHAEGVKSWCVLMKALMGKDMIDEGLQCFDNALSALEFHWGPYHPLHSTIYCIMAYLYLQKENYEDALVLYKNSLMCCLRVLGPNHPQTAEVYIELGNLYVSHSNPPEALIAIEKGYSIYEAALGPRALSTVTAGFQLAHLLISAGRYREAEKLVGQCYNVHEEMIEELNSSDDPSSHVKISHHIDKLIQICELAFLLYSRNENNLMLLAYIDRYWKLLDKDSSSNIHEKARMLMREAVATKFKLLAPDKKAALFSTILDENEEIIVEEEAVMRLANSMLKSQFREKHKEKGIFKYCDDLIESLANTCQRRAKGFRTDDSAFYKKSMTELHALLEVVGADVIEL